MVNYAQIQARIDRGKGKAAAKLGQPYTVFRCGPTTTGDYPNAWQTVATDFPVFRRRLKSEREIETAIANAALFYDIVGDMTRFVLGDVFFQTDPPYQPGVSYGMGATKFDIEPDDTSEDQFNGFGLAWHPPVRKAVGGRLDRAVRIYRATNAPTTQRDASQYWQTTHPGDRAFIMQNGELTLAPAGTPGSLIPAGFTSAYRPYGPLPFKPSPPAMPRPSHSFIYLPPLQGYQPREGDAIITPDDQRYVVVQPFYQIAGVAGSQLICDRTGSQAD